VFFGINLSSSVNLNQCFLKQICDVAKVAIITKKV
jgi:hypothetical protein